MIVSIHQPQYLPWENFFKKIKKSDFFVYLDNVEFQKNGLQNRNKIKTSKGATWLTVPVKHKLGQKIFEVQIDNSKNWRIKHWKTIKENYNKLIHFSKFSTIFECIFESNWTNLCELNIKIISEILNILQIKTKIFKASDLKAEGRSTELLINLCKKLNCKTYLSGEGGGNYLEIDKFKMADIQIIFHKNIEQKKYKQNHSKIGFIKNLSIIDGLFNSGADILNK